MPKNFCYEEVNDMTKEVSSVRVFIRLAASFTMCGAVFFGTAGTLKWLEPWLYLLISISFTVPGVIWMKKNDPQLLKDRMGLDKKKPKPLDRFILILYGIFMTALFVLPGLDVKRFEWSSLPLCLKIIGFLFLSLGYYVFGLTIKSNPYLSSIVEVHEEREHKVATTGPYKYIRHPWYTGINLFFYSVPLALGSLYALLPAVILTLLIIFRIIMEEKELRQNLPGYKEYCENVKHRIIPYIL